MNASLWLVDVSIFPFFEWLLKSRPPSLCITSTFFKCFSSNHEMHCIYAVCYENIKCFAINKHPFLNEYGCLLLGMCVGDSWAPFNDVKWKKKKKALRLAEDCSWRFGLQERFVWKKARSGIWKDGTLCLMWNIWKKKKRNAWTFEGWEFSAFQILMCVGI